jgi:mycothiol synthase
MANFPAKYIYRKFSERTDIPNLLKLRREVEEHDHDGVVVTEEALLEQLHAPGHDPSQDRLLAMLSGTLGGIAGYSAVWVNETSAEIQVIVHPSYRRQRVGTQLLVQILERAAFKGTKTVNVYTTLSNTGSQAFLDHSGFVPIGAYTEMCASLEQSLPNPYFPPGFVVKSYSQVNDLPLLTMAMNDAYQDQWGHNVTNEKEMAGWLPNFDLEGLFLLFAPNGSIAGISRVERSKERTAKNGVPTGYIDAPGIFRQYRNLGLYTPMLLVGMHWLKYKKQQRVELEAWGDDPTRLKTYQQYGFTVFRGLVAFQKKLA